MRQLLTMSHNKFDCHIEFTLFEFKENSMGITNKRREDDRIHKILYAEIQQEISQFMKSTGGFMPVFI